MKAAVLTGYDKNGRNLEQCDMPASVPRLGEVLVRVRTTGMNPLDNMIVRGEMMPVVPHHLSSGLGNELMGTVEASKPAVMSALESASSEMMGGPPPHGDAETMRRG